MGNVYLLLGHFSQGVRRGERRKSQGQADSWHRTQDKAWDTHKAFRHEWDPGHLVQTLQVQRSGRRLLVLPAVKLKVLPFCEGWTGENQFSTDPTTGICRNTPCKTERCSTSPPCPVWLPACATQQTHLFQKALLIGLLQLNLSFLNSFPNHFCHVFQKLC